MTADDRRRRLGDRWEETEDLVHIEQSPQAGGPGAGSHPADHLVEQQGDKEHPLALGQVRNRHDRHPRLAFGGIEQLSRLERFALEPALEAGRGQQIVELHGQLETLLGGIEGLQIEHPHLLEGRLLDHPYETRQIGVGALLPEVIEDGREKYVFAAADRIGVDPQQAEDAGHGTGDPIAQKIPLLTHRL